MAGKFWYFVLFLACTSVKASDIYNIPHDDYVTSYGYNKPGTVGTLQKKLGADGNRNYQGGSPAKGYSYSSGYAAGFQTYYDSSKPQPYQTSYTYDQPGPNTYSVPSHQIHNVPRPLQYGNAYDYGVAKPKANAGAHVSRSLIQAHAGAYGNSYVPLYQHNTPAVPKPNLSGVKSDVGSFVKNTFSDTYQNGGSFLKL
ncbi:uncharacterized protein LOC143255602 [Tachypleus tridentatus]|uniref:uncharacterized protein LOC143255602 n=1 Tax=Tachypleus tridentatus TaxID=6853 RepID=UPI003FD6670C